MQPPGAIRWSQGMFLLPQHFQQSDLHHSAELRYATGLLHPFPWGVRTLRIDVDALENDLLRVNQCEMIFPDGLLLRYPEAAEMKEGSFKDAFAPTMESIGAYLCVPSLEGHNGGVRRYAARGEEQRDLFDAESQATVEYTVPKAELVFTSDPEDRRLTGFQGVKIAEVRRTGRAAPRYELSRHYIPPLVSCDGSALLMAAIRQVHDQVSGAARLLAEHRSVGGAGALSAGAGDIEHLVALQMLNQFAPAVQHLLAHGGGHPFGMYSLLAELRGALATYTAGAQPLGFADYSHIDLGGCFFPLTASIREFLGQLMPTGYEEVVLQRDEFLFSALLDERLLRDGGPFILALRGPGTAEELCRRVLTQGKISSTDDMRQLIRFADRGVPTRLLEHPPAEVPRHADYSYFAIESGDPKWRKVGEDGDFAFYLTDSEPDLDVRLFVVLPRGRVQ